MIPQYPTVTRVLAGDLEVEVAKEQIKEKDGVVLKLWTEPDGIYVRCTDLNT